MSSFVYRIDVQLSILTFLLEGPAVSYITGPGSSGNNNLVAFDGITGLLAKDSGLAASAVTIQGNTFGGADQLVKLDGGQRLPPCDASLLFNFPAIGLIINSTPVSGASDKSGLAVDAGGKLVSAGIVKDGTWTFNAVNPGDVVSMTFIYGQLVDVTTL